MAELYNTKGWDNDIPESFKKRYSSLAEKDVERVYKQKCDNTEHYQGKDPYTLRKEQIVLDHCELSLQTE